MVTFKIFFNEKYISYRWKWICRFSFSKIFSKKKFKVTILDTKKPKIKKIKYIQSKLSNFEKLKKVTKKIDCVFHLAGVSDITKVKSIPLETIKNNILFSSYLIEACRINKIKRFIFASSIYIPTESRKFIHFIKTCH